ncbi:FRIGIDA-like protein 3 [Macadamia integrifolia]|uniref:FRIGIDA-like protein 3 n=1 Tax=Macadamia integrifolia TaxID=60698 RepID=UPI001C52F540|nr:FRIGIDA-like protein 3 [Macadamia integrifolia]XP_042476313.1 FRIGIDA-like protein 3 [Macadamia integrifolia]XP_042476314.1 FRIGIDA-like protein 3 [Macadamia integrifolia]
MDDTQSVATLIDSATSKIQQLQQAFAELENHRAITLNLKWKELEEHFHGLEKSLRKRFDELDDQEKQYETKASKAREMLEKREAAVVAKEKASLERLQDKRDAALSAIGAALEKYKKALSAEPAVGNSECYVGADVIVEEKPPDSNGAAGDSKDVEKPSGNGHMDDNTHSQLTKLCEEMDSKGLHKFISDNRKNLVAIKEEIPFALRTATNPARFVLDSLEDFYRMEVSPSDGKRDSSLLGVRRTCIMLMECLNQLLEESELGSVSDIISEDIKERAKAIAEDWKPKLDDLDVDASSGNSLEAHAFLQLLATFGIASDFNQEGITKLIPTVSRRRQTADLCRSLGLSEKMPGVIEVLVNSGRQIDAVNLSYAFELTEQFSPVPLLKNYLKEARKTSSPVKPGNMSPTAQNEVNERELTALKAVIKCIEDHKLEDQYLLDPLQKRVLQLEKAKADKKRVAETAKPQSKRPRANGGGYGPRITNIPDKSFYTRAPDRFPPYMYDRPYIYPGPTDSHGATLLGSAAYNLSPGHPNFFGNGGYQYQAQYLH